MNKQNRRNAPDVDTLIEAIHKKLVANRSVLEKSLHYGRLNWRTGKKSGQIEIDLEPKL